MSSRTHTFVPNESRRWRPYINRKGWQSYLMNFAWNTWHYSNKLTLNHQCVRAMEKRRNELKIRDSEFLLRHYFLCAHKLSHPLSVCVYVCCMSRYPTWWQICTHTITPSRQWMPDSNINSNNKQWFALCTMNSHLVTSTMRPQQKHINKISHSEKRGKCPHRHFYRFCSVEI